MSMSTYNTLWWYLMGVIFFKWKKNIYTQGSTDGHLVANGEWAIFNFKPWHTHSQNFERSWQISLNLEEEAFFKLLKLNLGLSLVIEDISTYCYINFLILKILLEKFQNGKHNVIYITEAWSLGLFGVVKSASPVNGNICCLFVQLHCSSYTANKSLN